MKIKTAYKIFLEFNKELMIYQEHAQTFLEFEEEKNKKYVLVDDLIKELDKVWHKINTCKMDKLRDNFITKTQVASYLSELMNALTSNSANAKTNKDLEVSASPTPKESPKAIPSLNPDIK